MCGAAEETGRPHHVHHIDMQKGNYATITLLYDKLFRWDILVHAYERCKPTRAKREWTARRSRPGAGAGTPTAGTWHQTNGAAA